MAAGILRPAGWSWQTKLAAAAVVIAAGFGFLSLLFARFGTEELAKIFAVTSEQNLPTWYSGALLLLVALTAILAALLARRQQSRDSRSWWMLAAVFTALSVDELVSLHERLHGVGALVSDSGIFHFGWVIPGMVLAALLVVVVVQFARHLPRSVRREVYLGIGVFLGAALGLEMVGGLILDTIGTGWEYQLASTTEEFAENLGAAIVWHAILRTLVVSPRADGGVRISYAVPHHTMRHDDHDSRRLRADGLPHPSATTSAVRTVEYAASATAASEHQRPPEHPPV